MLVRFFAVFLLIAGLSVASAQQPAQQPAQQAPPFSISGYTYQLLPNNVHMFSCAKDSCGDGSRVSYILSGPQPDYTFQRYSSERAQVAEAMRQRMGQDVG
ncbi:MAG: hypothetical protein RL291_1186, partial [Pseudomonadota bacterium]